MRIKNNYTHFKDNIEKNLFNEKQFLQKSSILSRQCKKNIYLIRVSLKNIFKRYMDYDRYRNTSFFLKIYRFMR